MKDSKALRKELTKFAYASSKHVSRALMDAAVDHAIRVTLGDSNGNGNQRWTGAIDEWAVFVNVALEVRDAFIEGSLFQQTKARRD